MRDVRILRAGMVEHTVMAEEMKRLQQLRIENRITDTLIMVEHPEVVTKLHIEFIRAGSDVVQAFTYYGHREKLKIIGKEDKLEALQKNALKIAKEAANEFPDLDLMVAGNVANTCVYDPNDHSTIEECRKMFEEQVEWAKEADVCLLYTSDAADE